MASPISNNLQSSLAGSRALATDSASSLAAKRSAGKEQTSESARAADDSVSLSAAARRLVDSGEISLDSEGAAQVASRVAEQMKSDGGSAMLAQASRVPDNIAELLRG